MQAGPNSSSNPSPKASGSMATACIHHGRLFATKVTEPSVSGPSPQQKQTPKPPCRNRTCVEGVVSDLTMQAYGHFGRPEVTKATTFESREVAWVGDMQVCDERTSPYVACCTADEMVWYKRMAVGLRSHGSGRDRVEFG